MVRPEPHQPFGETDLGVERRIDADFRLFEIDLLRNARPRIAQRGRGAGRGLGARRSGLRRFCLHPVRFFRALLRNRRRRDSGLRVRLAFGALRQPRRPLDLAEIEGGARGFRAREQIGIGNLSGLRPFEFGDQRAARIGRDRRDRSRPRPETESVQRRRRFEFLHQLPCAITVMKSSGRNASRRQVQPSTRRLQLTIWQLSDH